MNAFWWFFGVICGAWIVGLGTVGLADSMVRRRAAERDSIKDFHEKIDAMRRMAEHEGEV
jgi:hypothetical protein